MVVKCKSLGLFGIDSYPIEVEADLSKGIPSFDVVGLPDIAVKESRDRVRSAIKNCGLEFPNLHIIVNLAPADIKKEGPIYDLPILVAILKASGQIYADVSDCAFIGELSLSGDVRGVNGVLPMAISARQQNIKNLFIPFENASEGAVVEGINILPVKNIFELLDHLQNAKTILPVKYSKDFVSVYQTIPCQPT